VAAGFNIASVAMNADGKALDITIANDLANSSYAVIATSGNTSNLTHSVLNTKAAGSFTLDGLVHSTNTQFDHDTVSNDCVQFIVIGAQ
jgi:hypothetical protein